jgi:sulfatase modifying factor 1
MDYNAFSRVIVSTIAMSTLFLLVGGWDAHGERISLETVRVGNPGNAGELSGKGAGGYGVDRVCGRVAYRYNIGKYEVTNTQYAAFLNAVDAEGKNPHGIYNPGMGVDPRGGILLDGASPAGGMYSAKRHMGNKPVIFVSWLSAIRFANWLHNGQPTDGSGTEDGAYTMRPGVIDARNPGAKWFLPSEDEWYKAAYHKNDGTTGNYWEYPTVSDTPPSSVTANANGDGSAGATGNRANIAKAADWNGQDGNVTTVGTNGGPSAYGTFDQGGNVWEWTEHFAGREKNGGRIVRGANWETAVATESGASTRMDHGAPKSGNWLGFRVASRVDPWTPVPPATPGPSDLVPVGNRKQLLVDDYVIAEKTMVTRELGTVTKLNGGEPILEGIFASTVVFDEGKFKLWHGSYDPKVPAGYAESEDGIHFRKVAKLKGLPGGACFLVDPHETDPAHRYKACYAHPTAMAAGLAYSADGINWKTYNNGEPVTYRAADTFNQIVWDEDAKSYRLFTRTDWRGYPIEFRGTRSMTNPDVKADSTGWRVIRQWVLDRDGPDEWKRRQVYALTDWIYHGVHFGQVMLFEYPDDNSEGPVDLHKRHDRNTLNYYLATSRDADDWDLQWIYAGKPMVPRGGGGAWDKDMLEHACGIVTHHNKHWLYYSAVNERHGIWNPAKDERYKVGIGVATLRLDGFVYLRAGAEPGTVLTKPFQLAGEKLQVNVKGEEVIVEVLAENGNAHLGFSAGDAKRYKSVDELRLEPSWSISLSSLKGKVVRLKFRLKNANLYSFQVSNE